jgi:hypothetical protein
MPDSVTKRLLDLPTLNKRALCHLWTQLFDISQPSKLRRELMIPILAYRLQEQAFGAISARSKSRLRQLAQAFEKNPDAAIAGVPSIRPGTRLVRQWGDRVHLVNVEASGYEYQGARYRNLSEIARLITGTHWSGPLFFGIKSDQTNSRSKEAQ